MVGGGWRKLHNNQPGVVKQSKMEGSCKMYWRDEECNRDLVRKPDGQRYQAGQTLVGHNIEINLREIRLVCMYWKSFGSEQGPMAGSCESFGLHQMWEIE